PLGTDRNRRGGNQQPNIAALYSPFLCDGSRAARLRCLHRIVEWTDRNSTNRPEKISSSLSASRPGVFHECGNLHELDAGAHSVETGNLLEIGRASCRERV